MNDRDAMDLAERARAAALGDREAARDVLAAVQDDVYGLSLRIRGHVAQAGFLGGASPLSFDPLTEMPSGVQYSFFASAFVFGGPDLPLSDVPFGDIVERAERGAYRAAPAHVFDFDDIVAAHRLMESGDARGEIVVRAP